MFTYLLNSDLYVFREVARKLIKSGNIKLESKAESQVQFKRPKGQERKKALPEPTSYHPFSQSIEDDASKSPLPTAEKSDTGFVLS